MLALILETLGSTELVFILIIALMFFGPRKLPQLSRSLGKSLAEFRKASEDFKRTWEREVALESARENGVNNNTAGTPESSNMQESLISPVPAEQIIARDSLSAQEFPGEQVDFPTSPNDTASPESLTKREWL
ncbi:MAG TPA: twin-arginine translocase TatA/TatE family subunit [Pyrinomonadaceae bacterium]|nr:twin-arginine translocase TatA/TatE family subunit [Pyrinomonadaceae bacterium]HLE61744.1 twin-arginine translocase TatA/TatE family subunit [Pyrinomonadaceae bacterium]